MSRQDVVGMDCHGGLNSFKSAAAWARANPGQYGPACGVEVLSASTAPTAAWSGKQILGTGRRGRLQLGRGQFDEHAYSRSEILQSRVQVPAHGEALTRGGKETHDPVRDRRGDSVHRYSVDSQCCCRGRFQAP